MTARGGGGFRGETRPFPSLRPGLGEFRAIRQTRQPGEGLPALLREGTQRMTRSRRMRPRTMLDRPMRLLAVLAMTAALLAAFLPAPMTSADVETPTATVNLQVYSCPIDYAGDAYDADCYGGPSGYEILVTEDTDSADIPGGQPGVTATRKPTASTP